MLHADDLRTLRHLAASGMTRSAMATQMGMAQTSLDRALRVNGIKTNGKRGVPAQPKGDVVAVHGCGGQQPAKLMPSSRALGLVNIFAMGA